MKFFKNAIHIVLLIVFTQQQSVSQNCPSVNAQAGTGASTTICLGQCANLTATVIPTKSTSTYSISSIPYVPFSYGGGATLPSIDDVWSDSINIGFNFCFFGNTYNKVVVGSNGELNFNKLLANSFNNYNVSTPLPNTIDLPGNSICGVFKDIDLSAGGVSRTYTTGIAPCRKFVTYWSNVPIYQSPSDSCGKILNSFQIVLHENTNYIDVYVASTAPCGTGGNTDRGIIGIQNSTGTVAYAPPGRNNLTTWSAINEAWRFVPSGAPTFTVDWSGPSGFTATGLTAVPCPTATSTYTATMNVGNCDGTTTSYTSSVQVNIAPTASIVATSTLLCRGSASTLTGVGGTSYTWSPKGLTTSSIVVTPATATIYTLTSLSGPCLTTNTINISVSALPNVGVPNTSLAICSSGGSTTLTSIGASTYTWNPGGLTGNSVVVSPTITTQYTVTGANIYGCARTKVVTVNVSSPPILTVNTLSATVCAGSTTTLTVNGAATYTWAPDPALGDTVVVTPTANTIYTVTGKTNAGCINSETIAINVTPGITVTAMGSPTILCSGDASTLSAVGATTYTWYPGATVGNSLTVTPTVTTIYSVTGTALGCTNTKTVSITVNTPAINITKSPTITCSGTTATLTSNGAATYTWNPGGVSGNSLVITPSADIVYTVTGTNTMNCVATKTINISITANPTITIAASSTSICIGDAPTLTASGATSYTWSPVISTSNSVIVTPSTTTTYTVSGINAGGCINTNTISLYVEPTATFTSLASPSTICAGSTTTLSVSGAISYTWNPGAIIGSTIAVTPSSTTIYSVSGTTPLGCTNTSTLEVVVSGVNINLSSNPPILCSVNSATLVATGADTYTWAPVSLMGDTVFVTPVITTIYTVTGTNTLGCVGSKTLNLSVGLTPTITAATSASLICSGTTVSLSSTGALTYTWFPSSLTGSIVSVSPLVNTTFTVTGQNAEGCTTTSTVDVLVDPTPLITINSNPTVLCPGFSATLTATGAPNYTWSPSTVINDTLIVTPSATTIFSVVGTSSLGCSSTATINLKVNPTPTVTPSASSGTICAGNTATLTGIGANSYTWNPGGLIGGNVVVSPSANTIYTVTGDNGLGCISTETISIDVYPISSLTLNASPDTICSGSSTTLTVLGGTSYTWSPGGLTGAAITVNPTTTTVYTVSDTNAFGCINTETVSVTVFTPTLSATISSTAICTTESATLTANGGLTYTWSPGALTGSVIVVNPSATTIYSVTGMNILGCTSTNTVSLIVNSTPITSASASQTLVCLGNSTTLTGSGATSYTWNPGNANGATYTITPYTLTTYTLIGENAAGCSSTATITVDAAPNPTIAASSTNTVICAGSTITLTAAGAATYTWNPGGLIGSSVIATPTTNVTYTVIGENGFACISSETISINVNGSPILNISATPTVLCSGGTVTLTASGANTFTWNPTGATTTSIVDTPTLTTTYSVTGADLLGCSSTETLTISVGSPTITLTSSSSSLCVGATASLTASGATSYTWNPGNLTGNTITVTPTVSTTYTVDGFDGFCTGTQTITVLIIPSSTLNVTANQTDICAGSSSTLSVTGATSYTWSPGLNIASSITVTPTSTTTYTVYGDNGVGCITSETVTINVHAAPNLTLSSSSNILCTVSSVTLTASGANTFTWNPTGATTSSIVDTPTLTTTYSVTGIDIFGCSSTETITVIVGSPTITLTSSSSSLCVGATASLIANGATSYTWNPGNLTGNTITVTPTVSTTYTVDGFDGFCTGTETITVLISPSSTLNVTANQTDICVGSSSTLSVTGATSYTWSPGLNTTSSITVTPTSTTTYTVYGDNGVGCITSETVTINVHAAPNLTLSSSSNILCTVSSVTLTASGANTFTWNPTGATTSSIVDTPTLTTTYSVTGIDIFGCSSTETITVIVGSPIVNIVSTSSLVCAGSAATLTANGAVNYTWSPLSVSGSTVTDAPSATTTYTVTGDDSFGCTSTNTFVLTVANLPVISASVSPTAICAGSTVTLTAIGATNYTWMPTNTTGPQLVDNPIINTTYTITGDDGVCVSTTTVEVRMLSAPGTVTATANNTITCATATVGLTGNSTQIGAGYNWTGPNSYTSSVQNPTDIIQGGGYTLTVTDPISICNSTAVVTVITNTTAPVVSAPVSSPTLTCNSTVTLAIVSLPTQTLTFNWTGPMSFNSTAATPTTSVAGTYTVNVIDASNGCSNTVTITVGTSISTQTFTATVMAATCSGTVTNNDGAIIIAGYDLQDKYDLTQAATYTGTSTYLTGSLIPLGGVLTNTLSNPTTSIPYTIRVFSINGCFKDTTLILTATDCSTIVPNSVLGLSKAVSAPIFLNNNAYTVTYTIVATNSSTGSLTNVSIIDNLDSAFPLPTTYSFVSTPVVTSSNSSLTINSGYNGSTQNNMLTPLTSTLMSGRQDTIVFTIQINPNGFFGPFNNSAIGSGFDGVVTIADSSNTGFDWDPDGDGVPTNNNLATVVSLAPNTKIGVAKSGTVSKILPDKTIDVTYIISVKNLGNDTLNSVQVFDTLNIPSPAQYTIKSGPTASGSLVSNTSYNGTSDLGLLIATSSKLAPGAVETITLVLNITPNNVKSITNTAVGQGTGWIATVRDSSNTGSEPDPNDNGDATEIGENIPTVLELPDMNLFIPEVFTPDGDGKNDFFVIKGIEGRTVQLTVFNRWGNKVYENNAYDNTWNGTPNATGIIMGNSKLPQATYYYIVEFEDGLDKAVNGYVVLQY